MLLKIQIFIQLVTAQCAGVKTRRMSQGPVPHSTTVRESWLEFRQDRALEGQPRTVSSVAAPADSSPRAVHPQAGALEFRGVPSSAVRGPLLPA